MRRSWMLWWIIAALISLRVCAGEKPASGVWCALPAAQINPRLDTRKLVVAGDGKVVLALEGAPGPGSALSFDFQTTYRRIHEGQWKQDSDFEKEEWKELTVQDLVKFFPSESPSKFIRWAKSEDQRWVWVVEGAGDQYYLRRFDVEKRRASSRFRPARECPFYNYSSSPYLFSLGGADMLFGCSASQGTGTVWYRWRDSVGKWESVAAGQKTFVATAAPLGEGKILIGDSHLPKDEWASTDTLPSALSGIVLLLLLVGVIRFSLFSAFLGYLFMSTLMLVIFEGMAYLFYFCMQGPSARLLPQVPWLLLALGFLLLGLFLLATIKAMLSKASHPARLGFALALFAVVIWNSGVIRVSGPYRQVMSTYRFEPERGTLEFLGDIDDIQYVDGTKVATLADGRLVLTTNPRTEGENRFVPAYLWIPKARQCPF